jgi:hypothetical protein
MPFYAYSSAAFISRGLEAIVPNIATLDVVRVALAHTVAQGIVRRRAPLTPHIRTYIF